jgi:uncharacterized membrane protein
MSGGSIFKIGQADPGRVEAFSDAVLAIVLTLLVLELRPPTPLTTSEDQLWLTIQEALPAIGAWALSFIFVLTFWIAHHYLFEQLAKVDRGMLWINGMFLMFISFTPFPTAILAAYPFSTPATFLLSLAMFLTATSFSVLRWYAAFEADLIGEHVEPGRRRTAIKRSLISPVLYLTAMIMAFIWPPLSFAIQIIVPIIYFFPGPHERSSAGKDLQRN